MEVAQALDLTPSPLEVWALQSVLAIYCYIRNYPKMYQLGTALSHIDSEDQQRLSCWGLTHGVSGGCSQPVDRLPSSQGFTGIRGSASMMAPSHGCWQKASVPCHMGPCTALPECSHNMASSRMSELRETARRKLQCLVLEVTYYGRQECQESRVTRGHLGGCSHSGKRQWEAVQPPHTSGGRTQGKQDWLPRGQTSSFPPSTCLLSTRRVPCSQNGGLGGPCPPLLAN